MGSSRTRARTHVSCIGRRILNHCATREVLEGEVLTTGPPGKTLNFSFDYKFRLNHVKGTPMDRVCPVLSGGCIWVVLTLSSTCGELAYLLGRAPCPRHTALLWSGGSCEEGKLRPVETKCLAQGPALTKCWSCIWTLRGSDSRACPCTQHTRMPSAPLT